MTKVVKSDDLEEASKCLREGGLVAFPTETVYGLGANANIDESVKNIFRAKGRPADNPLIVHIWSIHQLEGLVKKIPKKARKLMEEFWPGPISFVLKAKKEVPRAVTAGLKTVAVRMPDNSVALELLKRANVPVAAPSANSSGKPSPTKASHVNYDLKGKIDFIVDGGKCDIGVESTVLDCTKRKFCILRPGKVTKEEISKFAKVTSKINRKKEARSPGMKHRHYTPKAKVYLVKGDLFSTEHKFPGKKVAYIGIRPFSCDYCYIAKDLEDFSRNIFSKFRKFDNKGAEVILVDVVKEKGLGVALMNRLKKAGHFID